MEDYKKKYEDACERAKEELQHCGSQDCDAAKQIFRLFPELAESEDEKIRKEIIKLLDDLWEGETCLMTDRKDYERYISWLEKQDGEKSQSDSKKLSEQIKDFEGEFGCWNSAQDFRPKHLQRCLCYDKYMKGVYCYVYDDMSKYWCTQTTEEHDPDGDNHICDYADYRVTVWMQLPDTPFYPSKSLLERQDEKPITIGKRQLTGKAAELAKDVTPESLEEAKEKLNAEEKLNKRLNKEIEDWFESGPPSSLPWCTVKDAIELTARHFFELGLEHKQKV